MSVSSISSSPAPLSTNDNTKPTAIVSAVVTDASNENTDASEAPPPPRAPLPPGQGTRIDQLV
jgi:hypothetical protein